MSTSDRQAAPGDPASSRILSTEDIGQAAARARRLVVAGKCVVLPTDTVYGIAADAFDAEAVQRLLDAKGRGRDMPPPVLVADPEVAAALATEVPPLAKVLMEKFWPGPLTLVLRAQPSLRLDLGDAEGTVAIRIPDHEVTRAVLRVTGPLAVSSANKTGQPAARSAQEAELQLGLSVAGYLDAGRSSEGPSSTIVDFVSTPDGALLRLGGIDLEQLREYLPDLQVPPELQSPEPEPEHGPAANGAGADEAADPEAATNPPGDPGDPGDPDDAEPAAPADEDPTADPEASSTGRGSSPDGGTPADA